MGLGIVLLDGVYPGFLGDVRIYQLYSDMAAMALECTGFPPFTCALQREIDIPIFSWGTLLDYAYTVEVHRDYYGHVCQWLTTL